MYPANRNERFSEHATAEHSIGTVLVLMQMVTQKQLGEALEVQKTEKRGVGKILVSRPPDLRGSCPRPIDVLGPPVRRAIRTPGRSGCPGIIGEDTLFLLDKI
jgi:hypothetical protein